MKRYAVVIEQAEGNYSACVPDLPGCVTVGDTLEEVEGAPTCSIYCRANRRSVSCWIAFNESPKAFL